MQTSGLEREFFLTRLPVPGTIEVSVETDSGMQTFEEITDWTYDEQRNSVQFKVYYPDAMAKVRMVYDVLSAHQDPAG